jgi:indole-3-glycerol phosphate synthase
MRWGGAAALSILTEPSEFSGSLADLAAAREATAVPLLRKDFIVDEVQLLEARLSGASAVLLIARALPAGRFYALAAAAKSIGLDVLLEVRDEAELERALGVPDGVIGVNNRNLETLVIDDTVSERLLRLVPPGRTAVYESGIRDVDGVRRAAALGADAVLVGSALSVVSSPVEAVRRLTGVARSARG